MISYLKTLRSLVTALLLMFCTVQVQAQQWDDKILISQCDEQYTLTFDGDKPIVKNTEKITYLSNSVAKVLPQTTVFYGEFISLDNISGHGQKQYTNVTPENVFYDDTKACTLQGEISKKEVRQPVPLSSAPLRILSILHVFTCSKNTSFSTRH